MTDNFDEDHGPAMNTLVAENLLRFRAIFIPYPRHITLHARFDYLQKLGCSLRGTPQKGLRVLAPSGSGKTKVASTYIKMAMASMDPSSQLVPVLYIQLEKAATARKLYVSLLAELGDARPESGTEQGLRQRVLDYLERLGVELLIIDEVQHLNFRINAQNDVTDALKVFLDAGVVPIVFLGTQEAESMFRRNVQLSNRLLPPCDLLPLDKNDPADRKTLAKFVSHLNREIVKVGLMPTIGSLDDAITLSCLYEASGGVIGRVATLFEHALEIATRRGASRIETYDLALAVDRWAIPLGLVSINPFRRRPC
ncbi:TniB family NTP-binding protein [Caulobacter henricii]|nr:TniB family NTP-binding protein [Caulobacter henricii]